MTFRIADSFSGSLAKLTSQEQKAVKTAAFDFQMNPANPGFSIHRVDRARDPDFWTARVNRDIRLVLHKRGGDTLLAYVAHHDDAYKWAETRRIDTHPRTGAAQIVEIRETVEEVVIQHYVQEAVRLPRLFGNETDETLLSWGIPEDWLEVVRDATEDTVLDIAGHLPAEAAEAILQEATGSRPEPAPVLALGANPYAHPDAGRRFRVMENIDELRMALDAPWDRWSVFLHPAQRDYVDRDFNGPARVIGSAGTGKTVVALHRAVRLAKSQGAMVLLTTFNRRLADRLRDKLDLLGSDEIRSRLTVGALSSVIRSLHEDQFGSSSLATDEQVKELLERAAAEIKIAVDPDFLLDEWQLIVDAWDIRDAESYRGLPRLGRKTRMAASKREDLWRVFARTRQLLSERGLKTEAQLAHELQASGEIPYTHVVVDEAQDISVAELRLLGAVLADKPNALFFAGDIGQRIFRAPFPWSAAGVEIRGRSRSLKVNYRTSHQIRRCGDELLPETLVEADGTEENRLGVTSVFDGPSPEINEFQNREAEVQALRKWLDDLIESNVPKDEIAILVRTPELVDEFAGVSACLLLSMHEAKGAEFRAVAVAALDNDIIPNEQRLLSAKDESQLDEIMATERHLLYVAATRARDHLWLSGVSPVSEFLTDLAATHSAR